MVATCRSQQAWRSPRSLHKPLRPSFSCILLQPVLQGPQCFELSGYGQGMAAKQQKGLQRGGAGGATIARSKSLLALAAEYAVQHASEVRGLGAWQCSLPVFGTRLALCRSTSCCGG